MTLFLLIALLQEPAHDHHAAVNRRGDAIMGFSHERTTHRFRLRSDGGEIEVTANEVADAESAAQIRGHLTHIAQMFRDGDFTAPLLIHAKNPPGTDAMARLRDSIVYRMEPLSAGARVRITTANAEALGAVHAFLRFQIADHRTGDPLTIQKP
jgi:hypothetical protein